MLGHESLYNYYKTNFSLRQHHDYGFTELDDMLPFEREIYLDMLLAHLEEERQRLQASKK